MKKQVLSIPTIILILLLIPLTGSAKTSAASAAAATVATAATLERSAAAVPTVTGDTLKSRGNIVLPGNVNDQVAFYAEDFIFLKNELDKLSKEIRKEGE